MKKIRPNHKFTYLTFSILSLALMLLLWTIYGTKWWVEGYLPYSKSYWRELSIFLISTIIPFIGAMIYRSQVYYLVEENRFVRKHGKKLETYYFKDIVYIDKTWADTHIDMRLFINTGKWVLLTMDKEKNLYKMILEKSPLMDKELFKKKYPNSQI